MLICLALRRRRFLGLPKALDAATDIVAPYLFSSPTSHHYETLVWFEDRKSPEENGYFAGFVVSYDWFGEWEKKEMLGVALGKRLPGRFVADKFAWTKDKEPFINGDEAQNPYEYLYIDSHDIGSTSTDSLYEYWANAIHGGTREINDGKVIARMGNPLKEGMPYAARQAELSEYSRTTCCYNACLILLQTCLKRGIEDTDLKNRILSGCWLPYQYVWGLRSKSLEALAEAGRKNDRTEPVA
ncbi:hypothetical protein BDZ88DRAFT_490759 [Geranomyces variabilis]|nr:hypothetical protein BDZ88DRAFT_490759 [Geranomyces variabilis]KAJ3136707.1 hypothetical protein HDU90_003084 [Geranomyces variabilis]